ncbi:hypothetical protein H0A36_00065 [Endozoicomonas sp. SM1973]|uniref:Uncharacterized protein n=1 Tax=Spartinivicinus marinus TaxID=2994442 RepID=A0A853HVD8_9GAMM|nr:hypothetical protein [Spartinivicinus marinus]MCX4026542.1 hypothetical protein [Spartinivicinus marinus]NYZ64379.1 hypothetical protein [Spartinivicinus marinus]
MTSLPKLIIALLLVACISLVSFPYLMYWYGLLQLPELPKPVTKSLSAAAKASVWRHYNGKGQAHVKPFGPYDYLEILTCIANIPSTDEKPAVISGCYQQFSGFEHVMSLVEQSMGKPLQKNAKARASKSSQVKGQEWLKFNDIRQIIMFSSQAIWISQNWTTDQILAALKK